MLQAVGKLNDAGTCRTFPGRINVSRRQSIAAGQRRWSCSLAVEEAAMYRRILLAALLGLTLNGCVPYSGGSGYYGSEIYSTPAPIYYGDGYGPSSGYRQNYYVAPPPRYYSPPRYNQAPRYSPPPRSAYRPYPDRGYQQGRPGYNGQGHGAGLGPGPGPRPERGWGHGNSNSSANNGQGHRPGQGPGQGPERGWNRGNGNGNGNSQGQGRDPRGGWNR